MAKRGSPLKEMINKSIQDLHNSGFPVDPSLQDESEISGPERFAKGQKAKDEVIIDSQLADIAGREGYFLKLKKELRPGLGEWMLMKTIETEWRQWADTETEVARIVKEHTKVAPAKWGTGPYQVEYACKGGMRGKTYPPRNFWINAEEEFLNPHTVGGVGSNASTIDPTTQVTSQLDMLGRLLDVTRGFQPPPLDPAKIQEQQAAAFEKGLAIKAGGESSNTQLMITMMTGLMGMMTAMATNRPVEPKVVNPTENLSGMLEVMKTFGVIGQPQAQPEKPKTFAETLIELKAIGLDIFKKEDPMEQMSKLKQFASIASDLMGMGGTAERPSILEKCVDMLGPALPEMVKQISQASGNAVQAQIEAGRNMERAKSIGVSNEGSIPMPMQTTTGTTNNGLQPNPQVVAFFNGLHEAVRANNRLYYPIIYTSLVNDAQGVGLINGIVSGTQTAKELIELLQGHGDSRFKDSEFVVKHLVSYVNGFIMWLRDMIKPKQYAEAAQEIPPSNGFVAPTGPGYEVECILCHQGFVFENAEEFMQETVKVCGHNGCVGALQPIQKVS